MPSTQLNPSDKQDFLKRGKESEGSQEEDVPGAVGLRASGAQHRIPGERDPEAELARGRGAARAWHMGRSHRSLASASKDTNLGTRGDPRGMWRPGRGSSVM